MFVDTHAHLYLEQFNEDIDIIIRRAMDSNVKKIYLPNIDSSTINQMHDLEDKFPEQCFSMMGLHPCSVKEDYKQELNLLSSWLEKRKYHGIGETGIDLYWDKTFKEQQIEAFEFQIDLAKKYKLPIIIHSRESLDLTIEIIEKHQSEGLKGIFHCFNGTINQAQKILDCNFTMGLGGVISYKNAKLGDMVSFLPEASYVLETDAPYLSPVPYRGKRNESSYIPVIANKVAEFKEISVEEVMVQTTKNALRLFEQQNN